MDLNLNTLKVKKHKNEYIFDLNNTKIKVELIKKEQDIIFFKINESIYKAKLIPQKQNNKQYKIYIFNFNKSFIVKKTSSDKNLALISNKISTNNNFAQNELKSPLAGRVITINIKPNQFVKKNQPLLVIESMKMENEIRAPRDTFIKTILISPSDLIKQSQILMIFEK